MTITTSIRHTTSPDSEEMIDSFIRNHSQGSLATINASGQLQSSVVTIFDLDGYHYAFMTRRSTRKHKNLSHNPTVSFLTYDTFSRSEAEIEGMAQLVTDEAQQQEIATLIEKDAHNGRRHVSPYVSTDDEYVLYVIYPRKIHMTTYWDRGNGVESFHEAIEFDVSMKS